MKLAHLARRFGRALWPGPPRRAQAEWAAEVLAPNAFELWQRMANHDRRHAIGVARRVEHMLAGTEHGGDPRWCGAALLHDVGKLDARLGIYGRVVATVCGAVAGREMASSWSTKRGFTRKVGLYLRHPELGRDRIRIIDGPPEAAAWAAAHHDPVLRAQLDFPELVTAALLAADDD